jgi:hypothetical protein
MSKASFYPALKAADPTEKNPRNDIKRVTNTKQLEKVNLEFDSPRLKQAMENLGMEPTDFRIK